MKNSIILTTIALWIFKSVASLNKMENVLENIFYVSQNQTARQHLSVIRQQAEPETYEPVAGKISNFPWIVSLQIRKYRGHVCSANVLTNLHVLTTCLCVSRVTGSKMTPLMSTNPKELFIIAGLTNLQRPEKELREIGQTRGVVQVHVHPRCTPSYDFDYAVLELEYYLYFTQSVQPMPRPSQELVDVECVSPRWHPADDWFIVEQEVDLVPGEVFILGIGNCSYGDSPVWMRSSEFVCVQDVSGELLTSERNLGGGLLCDGGVPGILSHQAAVSSRHAVYARVKTASEFLAPFYKESENRSPEIASRYNQSNILIEW